jgi:phosphatidate cytidylyltransferase
MMLRIISAAVLLPLTLLVVIYASPIFLMTAIGLVGTVCLYEYFRLIRTMGIQAQPWLSYCAFWILIVGFRYGKLPSAILLALALLALFLSALWRPGQMARERILALMTEVLGISYFTLFLYPAIPLRFDFGNETGLHWTMIFLFVIWAEDAAALIIGKTFGKNQLAPILSPNKTKEGAVGGLLAGLCIALAAQHFLFTDLPLHHVIIASTLIGIFGQLGDLAESMLKRAAGVKDSSRIIPGHGGVLDRLDSMLFALPVLYLYLLQLYGR